LEVVLCTFDITPAAECVDWVGPSCRQWSAFSSSPRSPAELASVARQASMHRDIGDVERALDIMREALTDWQGMLKQETGPARRAMQALLKGRLVFSPQECDGERFYTFEGEGTISPVIAGTAGLQRVWWPQRDTIELA